MNIRSKAVILDAELTACKPDASLDFGALLSKRQAHLCIWVFDILAQNARYPGLRRDHARIAVRAVIARMREALIKGERIELRRFATIKLQEKRSRRYRHPRTG